MDFNTIKNAGAELGTQVVHALGVAAGFVEAVIPGATQDAKNLAMAEFMSGYLAAAERKLDKALGIPDAITEQLITYTTNPTTIALVLKWIEAQLDETPAAA